MDIVTAAQQIQNMGTESAAQQVQVMVTASTA